LPLGKDRDILGKIGMDLGGNGFDHRQVQRGQSAPVHRKPHHSPSGCFLFNRTTGAGAFLRKQKARAVKRGPDV
jgi:hypothetical protein